MLVCLFLGILSHSEKKTVHGMNSQDILTLEIFYTYSGDVWLREFCYTLVCLVVWLLVCGNFVTLWLLLCCFTKLITAL